MRLGKEPACWIHRLEKTFRCLDSSVSPAGDIILETLSTDNFLKKNNISNNFAGIKLSSSGQNIIENNNIQDNDMEGLLVDISNTNQIEKNNFIGNNSGNVAD